MSKIILNNPKLKKCQLGDFNQMVNHIDSDESNKEKIKSLLIKLQESIAESEKINTYDKEDMLEDLSRVINVLSKPVKERDDKGLKHYWEKIVNIVKDVSPIFSIIKTLGPLLNLPLPSNPL
jgi:predicted phage tail protein